MWSKVNLLIGHPSLRLRQGFWRLSVSWSRLTNHHLCCGRWPPGGRMTAAAGLRLAVAGAAARCSAPALSAGATGRLTAAGECVLARRPALRPGRVGPCKQPWRAQLQSCSMVAQPKKPRQGRLMTQGILAFGAYIPWRRLQRKAIAETHGWFNPALKGQAKGERAFCNWDEDCVTMAVEAARD